MFKPVKFPEFNDATLYLKERQHTCDASVVLPCGDTSVCLEFIALI